MKPIFREDRDKRAAEKVLVTGRACGPKMTGVGWFPQLFFGSGSIA